jgi:hypothetical protein
MGCTYQTLCLARSKCASFDTLPSPPAAHMGIEQAMANAGFLYLHAMPQLQPSRAPAFRAHAAEYLRLAAAAGSIDASVQLVRVVLRRKGGLGARKGDTGGWKGGCRVFAACCRRRLDRRVCATGEQ